jgi:hypothetical protein
MPTEYPQFDIRSYDPQTSPALANLVMGRFDFMGLPHEIRVMRLRALIELYSAILRIGELEHTSDWDWRIEIYHAPANERATITGTRDDAWSDTFDLPYATAPNDYLDGFARWEFLRVTEFPTTDSTEEHTVNVPIDDIRTIHISYE